MGKRSEGFHGRRDKKEVQVFKVKGKIRSPSLLSVFEKEVIAPNKRVAVEIIYSDLGSKHKVKRRCIEIFEVTPVSDASKVKNPVIRRLIEVGEIKI